MKKMTLFVALSLIGFATFAQELTMNAQFHKVKIGHNGAYVDASESMVSRFFPAKDGGFLTYSITGGKHHGEYLYLYNGGKTFADRDISTPATINNIRWADTWSATVAPHIESLEADIIVYKAEYSNSKFEEGTDKTLVTEYAIKGIGNRKPFNDILKRFPKVWDKLGVKYAIFTPTTGVDKIISVRRLPNGWKELDAQTDFAAAYEEMYGKGSYDRDAIIVSNWWTRTDRYMMTKSTRLTSK
jgi:hypothetical protein